MEENQTNKYYNNPIKLKPKIVVNNYVTEVKQVASPIIVLSNKTQKIAGIEDLIKSGHIRDIHVNYDSTVKEFVVSCQIENNNCSVVARGMSFKQAVGLFSDKVKEMGFEL